jgi:zinc protease
MPRTGGAGGRGRRWAPGVGALVLLVLAVLPAGAAELPVVREQLPNGLTLLVRDNPTAPVVAMSLMIRMGTRWESADTAGISNFVQAVIVRGTTKRGGGEIAETIARLGGKLSATGDVDYSEIKGTALARFWRDLLGLVAELALHPALTPEYVDSERDFLLPRIQKREDNPITRAFDTLFARLFDAHPYGIPVLGTPESIERIDHEAILAWYRRFYRPERMVLAVSGQVTPAEVIEEARRLFGTLPGGAEGSPADAIDAPLPKPRPAGARTVVEQDAQQVQILVGALAPRLEDRDYAAVKVLNAILGGGLAGRLFVELRDKEALAYTVSAYFDPLREAGAQVLYMGTAPDNAVRAEAALLKQIERIRSEAVSPAELQRAKAYLLGTMEMDRRTNARQAWYLAFYELEAVGYDFPARYRRAVEAVTTADVLRVAKEYLEPLTTVVLRPPVK